MLCCERPDKLGRLAATKTPMDQQRKDYNYAVNTHNILSCQHQVHSVDPYRKRVLPNVLIIFFTRIIVLGWCYISIIIYYCECSTSNISLYHIRDIPSIHNFTYPLYFNPSMSFKRWPCLENWASWGENFSFGLNKEENFKHHWDPKKLLRHAHFITFSSVVSTKSSC